MQTIRVNGPLNTQYIGGTWRAFEFEGAAWNSLGEWNSFIWKANNDDVTREFLINIHDVGKSPHKYCFLIGAYEYKMKHDVTDVINLCFLVLKCLHQFSCSSCQKQGSPSTIIVYKNCALNPRDIKYIPTLSYCNNSDLYNQTKLTLKWGNFRYSWNDVTSA